jgi:hypothetical protein
MGGCGLEFDDWPVRLLGGRNSTSICPGYTFTGLGEITRSGAAPALCNQIALSNCWPSERATFTSSAAFCAADFFELPPHLPWQVLMDRHDLVGLLRMANVEAAS